MAISYPSTTNIIVINTVADLATARPIDNSYMITLGYNAVGDGLGRTYYYDADSVVATSGSIIIDGPGSVGRYISVGQLLESPSIAGIRSGSGYEQLKITYSGSLPTIPAFILRTETSGTGADNIDLVLAPAGTGSLRARTGGNARGANSIDLQTYATADTNVASGPYSVAIGANVRATAQDSICIGTADSNATGYGSIVIGPGNGAGGQYSSVLGGVNNAAGQNIATCLGGIAVYANLYGQLARNAGIFAGLGDAQWSILNCRKTTTDATQTELFLDGVSVRAVVPASKVWQFNAQVLGVQTGGASGTQFDSKCWEITGMIRRNGAGDTALLDTINTTIIGEMAATSGWDATIEADNTNEALVVKVTGEANKNIRWHATIRLNEIGQ